MKKILTILLFTLTFSCFGQNVIKQIPFKSDALFWLDGKVSKIGANYYFIDKTGNGRNFLITNYDFDSTSAVKGFPYKSAATISAPVGDAALMAADVDSFLYRYTGPNQIPVVSLYQDIDYEHKLFTRHKTQTIDSDSVEVFEPRVYDIVLYSTAKSSNDLTKCNSYYRVPAELNSTQAVWIWEKGDDATGNGTKANPWRSFSKIRLETKAVYVKTGVYTSTAGVTYTGATPINIVGVGMAVVNLVTYNFRWQRVGSTVSGLIEDNTNTGATFNSQYFDVSVTFNRCKLGKSGAGQSWAYIYPTAAYLNLNNCILRNTGTTAGFFACSNNIPQVKLNGCVGSLGAGYAVQFKITNNILTYNKFTQYPASSLVTSANAYVFNNKVTGNFKLTKSDAYYIKRNIVIDGQLSLIASNNPVITHNYVNASLSNKLTERPAFFINSDTGANYNGGEIYYNQFIGSAIGGIIAQVNQPKNCKIYYNYIRNDYVGTGTGHTLFVNGIDFDVRYNEIIMSNGHGIVVKSGAPHYTNPYPQIAYNVFRCTGFSLNVIWVRAAYGVIFANNTVVNYSGTRLFALDGNNEGYDSSLLAYNNVISMGGNVDTYTNAGPYPSPIVCRNNVVINNGYTIYFMPGTDFLSTTDTVSANGTPLSKILHAEISGGANNIGLAPNYSIPFAPTFQAQDSTIWQNGAVILQ